MNGRVIGRPWRHGPLAFLLAASLLWVRDGRSAEEGALQLALADNRLPAGALFLPGSEFRIFPTNTGTTIFATSVVVAYDLTGKEVHRISFDEIAPASTNIPMTVNDLSTVDTSTFDKPQLYFVAAIAYETPIRSYLEVVMDNGVSSHRYPMTAREAFAVSPAGKYFATYGARAQHPPEDMPTGLPEGVYAIYNREARAFSQMGSPADPYFFQAVNDQGWVAVLRGARKQTSQRVALVRVDGSTVWEKPVPKSANETANLSFTADGQFLIYARHSNDLEHPEQEIKIWDISGKLAYEHATQKPRLVQICGNSLVLIREVRSPKEHHFLIVDAARGIPITEFTIADAVQDVRARISPDGKTLYLAVHHFDARNQIVIRLEARGLDGRVISQQQLGKAAGANYLMFASYGDGVHWLVPGEGHLFLLKP